MDLYLLNCINQFAGHSLLLDTMAIFVAGYLDLIVVVSLILWVVRDYFVKRFDYKKTAKIVLTALGAATMSRIFITGLIHLLYFRPRPFVFNPVEKLLEASTDHSFPSGHATFFFTLSTVVYLYHKKAGLVLYGMSFLIVTGRVYAGLHYPCDILVGAILGLSFGWLVKKVIKIR